MSKSHNSKTTKYNNKSHHLIDIKMCDVKMPAMGSISLDSEIYYYVAVKGSPFATDCAVFGLIENEKIALCKRFPSSGTDVINGVMVKGPPIAVINALAELGYRIVSSTGEAEILWTLQRDAN